MGGKSRLWLLSAVLMAAGAALAAVVVHQFWQPCAGNMLTGSVFNGYRYEPEFTEACLVAMDTAPVFPLPLPGEGLTLTGGLGWTAAILLPMAWLVLLPTLARLPRLALLAVALPAILSLAAAADALVTALSASDWASPFGYQVAIGTEISLLLAVLVLGANGVSGVLLARYVIVLLATTATGFVHQMFEYMAATILSDANWDTPPATGYGSVLTIGLSALATGWLWRRAARSKEPISAAVVPA